MAIIDIKKTKTLQLIISKYKNNISVASIQSTTSPVFQELIADLENIAKNIIIKDESQKNAESQQIKQ